MLDGAGEKATSATGWVEHGFSQLGVDAVDNKLGDGARRVEFAGITCALQVFKYLLVDAAEGVAVVGVVKVNLAYFVDYLPHQGAGLHVVVGIFKHVAYHQRPFTGFPVMLSLFFQGWKELQC